MYNDKPIKFILRPEHFLIFVTVHTYTVPGLISQETTSIRFKSLNFLLYMVIFFLDDDL